MSEIRRTRGKEISISKIPTWWPLLKEVPIPMILMDHDGFIQQLNMSARKSLKYDLEDIQEQTLVSITDAADHQKEVKNSIDLFYGRKLTSVHQKKFITKGGKAQHVFQYVTVLKDENNDRSFAIVIFYPFQSNMLNNEILIEKLRQITGSARLFDFDEFGSAYNSRVVSEIHHLAEDLAHLLRN